MKVEFVGPPNVELIKKATIGGLKNYFAGDAGCPLKTKEEDDQVEETKAF